MENDQHLSNIQETYSDCSRVLKENLRNKNYRWLNFGYWENSNTVELACEQLIRLVAEHSKLQSGDDLLDVGFGFGVQDVLIAHEFPNVKITGLNIIPEQVQWAQEYVARNGLSNSVDLKLGDAVDTGFADSSFDKIFSIESAIHYNTRERFFKESIRLLRPGGNLCMTDCVTADDLEPDKNMLDACQQLGIPTANLYGMSTYIELLQLAGFINITVTDISMWVLPYANAFFHNMEKRGSADELVIEDRAKALAEWRSEFYPKTSIHSYYLINAFKPK